MKYFLDAISKLFKIKNEKIPENKRLQNKSMFYYQNRYIILIYIYIYIYIIQIIDSYYF